MNLTSFSDTILTFFKDNFSLIVALVLLFVLGPLIFSGFKKIIKVFLIVFLVVAIVLAGYLLYYEGTFRDLVNNLITELNLNSIIAWFNDILEKTSNIIKEVVERNT